MELTNSRSDIDQFQGSGKRHHLIFVGNHLILFSTFFPSPEMKCSLDQWKTIYISTLGVPATSGDSQKLSFSILRKVPYLSF